MATLTVYPFSRATDTIDEKDGSGISSTGGSRTVFVEDVAKRSAEHAFDFDYLRTAEMFGRRLIEDATDLIACFD
jgi:hypothetical protein